MILLWILLAEANRFSLKFILTVWLRQECMQRLVERRILLLSPSLVCFRPTDSFFWRCKSLVGWLVDRTDPKGFFVFFFREPFCQFPSRSLEHILSLCFRFGSFLVLVPERRIVLHVVTHQYY